MQALLDLIEDDRATRCGRIASDAQGRAQAALADAHRKARDDVRAAFAEERRRAADTLAGARARLATQRRHAEQRRAAALLDAGLAQLPDALARHWRDDEARARWIDAIVARCVEVLPPTTWQVAHPGDWPAHERRALADRIAGTIAAAPQLVPDPRIVAGLRVAAGGIVVDGTDAGLAGDRASVGARLLGLLETLRPDAARDG